MTGRTRREATRGAALVETSLVVGVILTLLLFAVQVGVLGFLQITVDAASFVNARQNAITVNTLGGPAAATNAIFPQVATNNITTQAMPAPSPSVPVDYGYNSTDPTERSNSVTNRHGGVSMLQPLLQQTIVSRPSGLHLFGFSPTVTGQATEPFWQECGAHDNVANQPISCGQAGGSTNYQVDYFKNGENTPPYYLSYNFIEHCQANQPWLSTCGSGNIDLIALGVAEFLDTDNWTRPIAGASGGLKASTFQEMACHQRAFNSLATFFSAVPDINTMYTVYGSTLYANLAYTSFSDFRYFNGFDPITSLTVQQIYSWDFRVTTGKVPTSSYTGSDKLSVSNGC